MRVYEEARGCYLRTKWPLSSFFCGRDQKKEKNFFAKFCPFSHQLGSLFDWGLALNPIAFLATQKFITLQQRTPPPLGYDTREMAAPKKKKGEDVKRERERES